MAGRRPQSNELKLIKGERRSSRLPPTATAEPGWPDKPSAVAANEDASAHWDYLAGLLDGERRLTKSDGPLLMAASVAYAIGMKLTRGILSGEMELFAEREHVDPDDGQPYKTLEKTDVLPEERQQWERYRKAVNDLCLSPGTRARAKVAGDAKPSKLKAFLGGKPA